MSRDLLRQLVELAAAPYRTAGNFAWHFARGKLGRDPVFAGLLEHGLIPNDARILDIGCGQGLLASWLNAANALHHRGVWPAAWPAPPRPRDFHGIEMMPRDIERAREALGTAARFTLGDMRSTDFGGADAVVILDVLHYVDIPAQDAVLKRVRDALAPHGTLLLRVGDAAAGLPFKLSFWVDHVVSFVRGHRRPRMHCRSLHAWRVALTELGFDITPLAMHKGTPFANVLLVGKLRHNNAPAGR